MSWTKTQICNMALFHLGTSKEISNVDATSETSEEARTLRVFWDAARLKCLTGMAWPFARKIQALSLIEEDPTDEWNYSYQYPSDAASINKICNTLLVDSRGTAIPYQIANNGDTKLIYTNEEEAIAEYTLDITSTAIFSAEFVLALSYLLASMCSIKLSRNNPAQMREKMLQLYLVELSTAKANSLNEEQNSLPVEAETIEVR